MRKAVLVLASVAALLPATATTTTAASAANGPVPIAQGLNNPRQLAFGPDGALYVAEAGSGRMGATLKGRCFSSPEAGTACSGNSGSVVRIGHPATAAGHSFSRVAKGFLSIAAKDGSGATGIDALTFRQDGTPYGIMTYVPPRLLPQRLAWQSGQLLTDAGGRTVPLSNVGRFSFNHPLRGHERASNPYGVAVYQRVVYIADAANNTLLRFVNGKLSVLHKFRHKVNGQGVDAVPTSVTVGPGGLLYVGELASFVPNGARIYVIEPRTGKVVRTIYGLTTVTAVDVAADGTVYASEMFAGCPPDDPNCLPGRVAVIPRHGARYEIDAPLTGGVAVHRGHLYASVFSLLAGPGAVWRLS